MHKVASKPQLMNLKWPSKRNKQTLLCCDKLDMPKSAIKPQRSNIISF